MRYDTLMLETSEAGVATLTLNRADKHNAMSPQMLDELTAAAGELDRDEKIRAVVLTGAGRSFCAGGDLAWMRQQIAATREERLGEGRRLAYMLNAFNTLSKPLIGRIQGQAFGGGIGLISICDVAIAVDTARFGLTETRLGLIPATISPYILARIGEGMARRVFMSSRVFDAAEATALGLIARHCTSEELDEAVAAEVAPYLAAAPGAVAAAKALARSLGPRIDAAVIEASVTQLADIWETAEAREGLVAFFGKRPAAWVTT